MEAALSHLVTINGGSSSIKFAIYAAADRRSRIGGGVIERIGTAETALTVTRADDRRVERRPIHAADHRQAAEQLADWLLAQIGATQIAAVGHRVVHGGTRLIDHQRISAEVLAALREAQPIDLAHLPREIALIEVFTQRLQHTPQFACFDTTFFRELPRIAQALPIPRKYDADGIRRFGFHGLSYSYLASELRKIAPQEAAGRVIVAHLGSGASMAAMRGGQPIDTSMAFTPTAGLVMGTRPGDLDPGLLLYLMRVESLSPEQMDDFIHQRCGIIGRSETTSDMRDLLARRADDPRASEAVALFCYQAKKFIGAYAAALGGLDSIVFSGGIGEHAAEVRAEICDGLGFLGVRLDAQRNLKSAAVISADGSPVAVRVIPTDEELVIAEIVGSLVEVESAR
ncbi:MAG: acetate/propionate family kinase [Pirellulales bacterium]|nr:acetate/propionate family kinase [Pirellulales bacterium]